MKPGRTYLANPPQRRRLDYTSMVTRAPDPDNGGTLRILASAGHRHDPSGRRQNTRREDGTKWEYGYNDRSEVTSAVKTTATSEVVPGLVFGYHFDAMGNRTSSTVHSPLPLGEGQGEGAVTTAYTPDALNQYGEITTPGGLHILARSDDPVTIEIDSNPATITTTGNLRGAHATLDNSTGGAYPEIEIDDGTATRSGHRWIAPAILEPQYDDDGNLTQDGRWTYHWDAEHRLVKLETLATALAAGAPALTIEYTYDWRSRKIRETVTEANTLTHDQRTLYDHWNPVADFTIRHSSFVIQNSLLWGPDLSGTLQGAGGVGGLLLITDHSALGTDGYFPSFDTNGNIIAWSDSTGKLVRRLDYDPFGNTVIKENLVGDESALDAVLRHGFSTKPADPHTGLLYYGYRWLDPANGRWPSRDPIEEEGGINLYGFVGNDGVNLWDFLGLSRMHSQFSAVFNPKIQDYSNSRILSDPKIGISRGLKNLQRGYRAVKIIESSDPDEFWYSKFRGTISVSTGWTFSEAAHESVHAYNDKFKTGIAFNSWDDEGMAYGFENIIEWADLILELERFAHSKANVNCETMGETVQRLWRNAWVARRKPGQKSKFLESASLPISAKDYMNIKTHLSAAINCSVARDAINDEMKKFGRGHASPCCIEVSCDAGPWVQSPSGLLETYYVNDNETVDAIFR